MATPSSVLFGTPLWGRDGGVAAHVQASARLLVERGVRVTVLAAKVDPDAHVSGVAVHHSPGLFKPDVAMDARVPPGLAGQADVAHLHQLDDPEVVAALRRSVPVVVSAHAYTACAAGEHYFRPGHECTRAHGPGCAVNLVARGCAHVRNPRPLPASYRRTTRALAALRRADLAVAYSGAIERHLAVNGVARRAVVPLFATMRTRDGSIGPDGMTGPDRTMGPDGTRPVRRRVLFAGRIVKPKGLGVLIRAMRAVDGELVVCGDGFQLDAMRRLARRAGIENRVEFRGWLGSEQLARELADAAVVAVPSLWPEPFGLVGIEALSAGRPVVASLTGGVAEWLRDGVTGVAVRPGDVGGLARALTALLDEPKRGRALGAAGRELVTARFSPERHVEALLESYRAARASWEAV